MMHNEIPMDISISKNVKQSFNPVNTKIAATPYFTYWNFSCNSPSKKYKFRSPKIAKMLEVYTMKVSVVIEKIAGIESIAKRISVNSIISKIANKGVA